MTKQQYLHASKLLMELAELFKVASEQQEVETPVVDVIQPLVEKVEEAVEETTVAEEQEEAVEDLSTMTIQQLRALAKTHGLSTKGTKKDLIARITDSETTEEQPEEEVIEEVQEPEVVEEIVEEEVEVEDDQDEDEDVEEVEDMEDEELDQMEIIQAELEGMSLEELQEILESVDLPTKGKKQALISRILEAVEDGVLEFEDEVDENYDADEEDAELDEAIEQALDGEETTDEEEYEEVEVDEEDEDEEEELSPREATQQEIEEEIAEAYENGDLTDKEIANFLDDYFNGKFKPINKKRAYNKYVEIMCDLVDADGDRMDMQEAYYINDEEIYCCGSEIKELDNGNLFCEVCGTEYETE